MMHRLLPFHFDTDLIYVDAETFSKPTDELLVDIYPYAPVAESNNANPESVSSSVVDNFLYPDAAAHGSLAA